MALDFEGRIADSVRNPRDMVIEGSCYSRDRGGGGDGRNVSV